MNVAITGASGYVGSLLVETHAKRGDSVRALTRSTTPAVAGDVRVFHADITRARAIPRAFYEGADVLYHCAAEIEDETLMQAVNVDGTRNLLAAARGSVGHWVQVSSVAVYGDRCSGEIIEETAVAPADIYASTRSEADAAVVEASTAAFSYSILRPSAVVGPRMRNRSIHAWLSAIDRGLFFFIGEPGAKVNYVHEDNVVDALVLCATRAEAKGRTYNLSQDLDVEATVAALARAIGRATPRARLPRALAWLAATAGAAIRGFPLTPARVDALTRRVTYPSARIEHELGYRHRAPLEEALTEIARLWAKSRDRSA